jgi:MFS transporter, DHA2 family, multidrug resistance protein
MRAKAASPDDATGRAIDLLGLTIRKQAFTLAVTDCFVLLASAALVCLIVISCVGSHKLQYKNLIASIKGQKA